jgi:exodeoxyribonuclease VII small subunit
MRIDEPARAKVIAVAKPAKPARSVKTEAAETSRDTGRADDADPIDGAERIDGAGEDAGLSYEQARERLTEVVRRLESGGLTLEESLALWERGEKLATTCEVWLEGARARLSAAMAERADAEAGDEGSETPF